MTQQFAFQVSLSDPYEKAVEKVIEALKPEGFGILTRIDVKATFNERLDADFRPYVILGACNPPLAHRALQNEALTGLLLPCNVTVEETESGSLVSILNPDALHSFGPLAESEAVRAVAAEARARLERVVASLEESEQ